MLTRRVGTKNLAALSNQFSSSPVLPSCCISVSRLSQRVENGNSEDDVLITRRDIAVSGKQETTPLLLTQACQPSARLDD